MLNILFDFDTAKIVIISYTTKFLELNDVKGIDLFYSAYISYRITFGSSPS